MKKTYKNPEIEVVKIAAKQMLLETSTRGFGGDVTDTSGADAHFFDFDDEN